MRKRELQYLAIETVVKFWNWAILKGIAVEDFAAIAAYDPISHVKDGQNIDNKDLSEASSKCFQLPAT